VRELDVVQEDWAVRAPVPPRRSRRVQKVLGHFAVLFSSVRFTDTFLSGIYIYAAQEESVARAAGAHTAGLAAKAKARASRGALRKDGRFAVRFLSHL
jgi:hypothetical protein